MTERIGDAPIEPAFHQKMNELAHFLDHEFNGDQKPKKVGFVMLVFPFDDHEGRCNYISNARAPISWCCSRSSSSGSKASPT